MRFIVASTGAYLVYFSKCIDLFKYSIRGRASKVWPIVVVCILMFFCTIGVRTWLAVMGSTEL